MTILADFLRDNSGNVLRVYPDALGELHITSDQWGSDDGAWTSPTYTIPTEGYEYRTLADSGGTTWYAYLVKVEAGDDTHWEITLSTTAPTAQPDGIWRDPKYGTPLTETQSDSGDEIYLAMADLDGTGWYVYPNTSGELIITQQIAVVPVVPPVVTDVTILSAVYNSTAKTLYVTASSTSAPTAVLTATGYGVLTYISGLVYRRLFMHVLSKPASVTVTSSVGGTSTMTIL